MKYSILITIIMASTNIIVAMEQNPQRGILIAIEGIDGSGKSTLARHLYDALKETYTKVKLTKEPGDTKVGQKIREIVQTTPLDAKTEYLLFAADRAEHFSKVIQPLLKENYIIISDRLADSSLAYQGYGRDLNTGMIETINRWAMNNVNDIKDIKPNLTIFVKVPVETALERIQKRNETVTTFEKEQFLEKVAKGFKTIYKENYNNSEEFKLLPLLYRESCIEQLKQNRSILDHLKPLNLITLNPAEFATIPAQCVKLITVDGTKSEEEIADTTIPVVQQWIAINNQ
jgi:dTMP kinase